MAERIWQRFPFQAAPYLFAIFFVLYSHEINNFNLTIDDERHAFSNADFVALGRWLIPIVQSVWPQLVVPWAPYLIFGALISIAYCLVLGLLGERTLTPFHYLCFAAFVALPRLPRTARVRRPRDADRHRLPLRRPRGGADARRRRPRRAGLLAAAGGGGHALHAGSRRLPDRDPRSIR